MVVVGVSVWGRALMKDLGLVRAQGVRVCLTVCLGDSFVYSCHPPQPPWSGFHFSSLTLCPLPQGHEEVCPHDPGRNPRLALINATNSAADVSAWG